MSGTLACTTACTFNTSGCTSCGDAVCAEHETNTTCATDCAAGCGDNTCALGESCVTCPFDCSCNTPFELVKVAGEGVSTVVGKTPITGLLVRVQDANEVALRGVTVTFSAEPGVQLALTSATTDLNGNAATSYRAGLVPGDYEVDVTARLPDGTLVGSVTYTVTVSDVTPGTIFTVVNSATTVGATVVTDGPSVGAQLNGPYDVAVGPDDTFYVADRSNNRILRVTRYGAAQVVAGGNGQGFSGDLLQATQAKLALPQSVAVDPQGRIIIADTGNNRLRRVENGVITTIAGGGAGGEGALATAATLTSPTKVVVMPDGVIYFMENNARVRRIGADQIVTTVLNNTDALNYGTFYSLGVVGDDLFVALYSGPGSLSSRYWVGRLEGSQLVYAAGALSGSLTADGGSQNVALTASMTLAGTPHGGLLVGVANGNRVLRHLSRGNYLQRLAGVGTAFSGDYADALTSSFGLLVNMAVDSRGNVLVADSSAHCVRMIRSPSVIAPWSFSFETSGASQALSPAQQAPSPVRMRVSGPSGPVPETQVQFSINRPGAYLSAPTASADGSGWAQTLVTAGRTLLPHVITATFKSFDGEVFTREIAMGTPTLTPDTILTVVNTVGVNSSTLADNLASQLPLSNMSNITLAQDNTLYVQQSNGGYVVTPEGMATVSGIGGNVFWSNSPSGMTVSPLDHALYYSSDGAGGAAASPYVYMRTVGGTLANVSNGGSGCGGTTPLAAQFSNVWGLAFDPTGRLFVTDQLCPALRVMDAAQTSITTLNTGSCGSGNQVLSAYYGVGVGPAGEVYVSGLANSTCATALGVSSGSYVVLRYSSGASPGGTFTRVAGGGAANADGVDATTVTLATPYFLAVGDDGALYISERSAHRVRVVREDGLIDTVVGDGTAGAPLGLESTATARLNNPMCIAFGGDGNLYIADNGNNAVRMVVMP